MLCKQSQLSENSFRQSFIVEVVNRKQITVNKISKEYSGHRYVVFEKAVKKFCQTDPADTAENIKLVEEMALMKENILRTVI